jgi:cephalosporin hydroxylase
VGLDLERNLDLTARDAMHLIQNRMLRYSTFLGVKAVKNPLDAWIYQEIIYETRPDAIVEIGTYAGGGTLYLAHLCDAVAHGAVISVDVDHSNVASSVRGHERIALIQGDACAAFRRVRDLVGFGDSVLVIDDSSHTYANTLNVLRTYSDLVQLGGYFIVEDTNGHLGIASGPRPGPYEAVDAFIAESGRFQVDRTREAFFITSNPKGFLRCTR